MVSRTRAARRSSQPTLSPKPATQHGRNSISSITESVNMENAKEEAVKRRSMSKPILPNIAPREPVNAALPDKSSISSKKRSSIVFEMPQEIEKREDNGMSSTFAPSSQQLLPKLSSVLKKEGVIDKPVGAPTNVAPAHYVPRRMSTPATLIPYFYKSAMAHQTPQVPVIVPSTYPTSSLTSSPPFRKRISIADLVESTSATSLNSVPVYGIDRMVPHVAPLPTIPSVPPSIKYQSLIASSIMPRLAPRPRSSPGIRQSRKSVDVSLAAYEASKLSTSTVSSSRKNTIANTSRSRQSVDGGTSTRRGKNVHNMAERIRRQNLNDRIRELQSLLPVSSPTSTCETLQLAAEYIDRLTSVGALFQRELAKVNFTS